MSQARTNSTVATEIGRFAQTVASGETMVPADVRAMVRRLIIDVVGLCAAARRTDYVQGCLAATEGKGLSTAIGHRGRFTAIDAALINGTAAHGEDFDDTFEGGPVHAGAPVVPAVLAMAERYGLAGESVVRAIAVGVEVMCRGSLVAPQAIHKAGFHPTAVLGAMATTAALATLLKLPVEATARALGIAGSMASGIIEYLADGSSTKRLHAGLAAQSGIRAVLLARGGVSGPPTVFEGAHGFYKAFAPSKVPDFTRLTDDLGTHWVGATLAFKPFACGTMTQPYVDCAIALARSGVKADDIVSMVCEVGEGTVHRLWEPLALKQSPPNGYAAKFSTPDCIAVGFLSGDAGLLAFEDAAIMDPARRSLAARISHIVDPANPYPRAFTGHIRATLRNGAVHEVRQPHMRGGVNAPLSDAEIIAKYRANIRFGGWSAARGERVLARIEALVCGQAYDMKDARA
ncbi:MAG: MmgE/PrpD family protein [Beijerinckiaceae bacterium]